MVDYYQDLAEFQTTINLSPSQDRILAKIKLTPPSGWGRKERDSATKLMEILRAHFLNLSAPLPPSKPKKLLPQLVSVMFRSLIILFIAFILCFYILVYVHMPLVIISITLALMISSGILAFLYKRKRKK